MLVLCENPNPFINMLRIKFGQIPGHLLSHSKWHITAHASQELGLSSEDLKFVACYVNWCVCSGKDFISSPPISLRPSLPLSLPDSLLLPPLHFFFSFPMVSYSAVRLAWPITDDHSSESPLKCRISVVHNHTWLLIFKGQLWPFSHKK